jgi:host factor-I protein
MRWPREETFLMPQATEPSTSSATQSNVQDMFLNLARRDRVEVTIVLMDGRRLDARIKSFDKFALIVEVESADQLVFKHAIATIETPRSVPNYFSHS